MLASAPRAHFIIWPMNENKGLRHGGLRLGSAVYLVFLTKYRLCNGNGEVIEIFSKVCSDFEAELVGMVGQSNHVRLLVNYASKVAASSLVNSLKGSLAAFYATNCLARAGATGRRLCGRLISTHPAVTHRWKYLGATRKSGRRRNGRGFTPACIPGLTVASRHTFIACQVPNGGHSQP
jgi:REP element-mobilizing transposase RayT